MRRQIIYQRSITWEYAFAASLLVKEKKNPAHVAPMHVVVHVSKPANFLIFCTLAQLHNHGI